MSNIAAFCCTASPTARPAEASGPPCMRSSTEAESRELLQVEAQAAEHADMYYDYPWFCVQKHYRDLLSFLHSNICLKS